MLSITAPALNPPAKRRIERLLCMNDSESDKIRDMDLTLESCSGNEGVNAEFSLPRRTKTALALRDLLSV